MSENAVYIRGWGAVSTLGWTADESARRLLAGDVRPAGRCSSSHLVNCEFKAFEAPFEGNPLDKALAMLDRSITEAFDRGRLSREEIAESSLLVGTTGGLFIRNEFEFMESVRLHPEKETPPISCRNRGPGETTEFIAEKFGIGGMTFTLSMACVSSSHALVVANGLLRQGKIRRAVIVGFEPLLNMTLHGFSSLLLYDADRCRPFCNTRSGMQIGEGAACIILEAKPASETKHFYAFKGGYLFNDNSSLTSAGTDGEMVKTVVEEALGRARVAVDDIVAVKAHGTGTRDNDLSEGRGLKKVFGEGLPPVISLKGAIGHELGAAGAVETAIWLSCLEQGSIPASVGFSEPDPEIGLIPSTRILSAADGAYLFNFFGFGATFTSYVIERTSAA